MFNIKTDSRKIKKGDTFVALRGISSDGHDYIEKAISLGASKLIVEEDNNYSIPYEVVEDTRKYLEDYLIDNYSEYINEMNIIGLTGTNGKTTTAYLIYQALNLLNDDCAYIGTLGYYKKEGKIMSLPNTSPDICDLYELIIDAYDSGYRNVVLEVSSQGLIKRRLEGIKYNYGIFTNLTQDHLDEHKTMENYAKAKRIMFDNLKDNGISILNYDDKESKRYETKNNIYYGFNNGDFKVLETTYNNQNTIFKYSYNNNEYSVNSSLLGDYNVYNMLSCIAVLTLMNININDILKNIPLLKSADGRLDIVKYDTNSIIVDYAHTPDAISKVISAIKPITKGNLYTVFGCTGDRDRTKRPIMMNIVTSNCKYAIVTMDDPHNEDPMHVVDDMLENNKNNNYEVIINRGDAIKKGISLLEENDSLLVLGKGHEEFIIYGKERIPFNDKKEIEKIIKELEK